MLRKRLRYSRGMWNVLFRVHWRSWKATIRFTWRRVKPSAFGCAGWALPTMMESHRFVVEKGTLRFWQVLLQLIYWRQLLFYDKPSKQERQYEKDNILMVCLWTGNTFTSTTTEKKFISSLMKQMTLDEDRPACTMHLPKFTDRRSNDLKKYVIPPARQE